MPNYRRGVYDFIIDSSFQPFTMQEMLVPFTAYKEEYEKMDAAYTELSQKASDFEYLSKTLPEDSKARQIYEGYANDLRAQADDLTKNGLGMGNRRALLNMKRRYSGEIGRLVKADEALKQEQTLRRQMSAKDPSMLYAVDNLSIDSYLDNQTPNLYGISGNELYTKGAAAGQSASKRVVSAGDGGKTLGGYYRDYVQKMGYNADTIAKFRQDAAAIPELQQAADDILKANGVTDNLSGESLARARQQVINGMIDGAVYSEVHNPTRDLGVMSAEERDRSALGWANYNETKRQHNNQMKAAGFDEKGNYHPEWSKKGAVGTTKYGNPVYKDELGRLFALGKDGKRYYDNNGDTVYTDETPKAGAVAGGLSLTKVNPSDWVKLLNNNGTSSNGTVITGTGEDTSLVKMDMSAKVRYTPFYGDALYRHAENGFDISDVESSGFREKDAKPYSIDRLKSNEAKQQLRDYVQEIIPDVVNGLNQEQIDEVIGYMDFQRDYDWGSDNHFRLRVPGTDSEGKVVNGNAFNGFLTKVNQLRIRTINEGARVNQTVGA